MKDNEYLEKTSSYPTNGIANFATFSSQIAIMFLLFLASILPFSASLNFPLLEGWDDHIYVLNNVERLKPSLENLIYWFRTPCEGCYLPLVMISYMLDYAIGGTDGFIYHLQNLLWHFLTVMGVYTLFRQLGIKDKISLLCALFYAVHPQRVESVVWISERKDVMCGAFYFWSLNSFILTLSDKEIAKSKTGKWWLLSFILAIFAFLSKPMAVSLPLIMFLISYYLSFGFSWKNLSKLGPFFVLAIIFVPVAILFQDIPPAHMDFYRRFLVVIHNIPWYFGKTFFPLNLSPIYSRIVITYEKIFLTILFYSLLVLVLLYCVKRTYFRALFSASVFLLCFLFSFLPVSGFVPLGAIDYADRYTYIPSVFLLLLLALILEYLMNSLVFKKFMHFIFAGYLIMLSLISYFYSFAWSSYKALLETAMMSNPPPYIVLGALADYEFFRGDKSRVVELAKIARTREVGWESKSGVERIIFKLDILEMHYYYQSGQEEKAAKIAKHILNLDLRKFIENEAELERFRTFLKNIIN